VHSWHSITTGLQDTCWKETPHPYSSPLLPFTPHLQRGTPGPDCRPDSERVTAAPAAPSPAARVAHSATATRTPSRTLAPAAPASTHCLQQHPPLRPGAVPAARTPRRRATPHIHTTTRGSTATSDRCVLVAVVCVAVAPPTTVALSLPQHLHRRYCPVATQLVQTMKTSSSYDNACVTTELPGIAFGCFLSHLQCCLEHF
jgi:hypothetical protein